MKQAINEFDIQFANPIQQLKLAMKQEQIVSGLVYKVEQTKENDKEKERVHILLEGNIKAFCSEDDFDALNYISLKGFIGHNVDVIIKEFFENDSENGTYAVVSRKEAEERKKDNLLETLKEGDTVNGKISGYNEKNDTIFINIGGVDAFCYLSDWDHIRIPNVEDVGPKGKNVTVQVKKIQNDPFFIRVSRKELLKDPWEGVEKEFPKNSTVLGVITNVDPEHGIFVRIKRGVTIKGRIPTTVNLPQPLPEQTVRGTITYINEKENRGLMIINNYPHGVVRRENPGAYLFE